MRAVIASLDITCVSANSASVGRLGRPPFGTRDQTPESPAPVRRGADPLNVDLSAGTPFSTNVLAAAPPDIEPLNTEPLVAALLDNAPFSTELLAVTLPGTEPLAAAPPGNTPLSTELLAVTLPGTEAFTAAPPDIAPLSAELLAVVPLNTELLAAALLAVVPLNDGFIGVAPLDAGPLVVVPLNAERIDGESTMIGWINVASVNVDGLGVDGLGVDGLGVEVINVGGIAERLDIEVVAVDPHPTGSGTDAAGYPGRSSDAFPRGVTAIEHLLPGRGPPVDRGRELGRLTAISPRIASRTPDQEPIPIYGSSSEPRPVPRATGRPGALRTWPAGNPERT
ncbi:hypothetical protein [Actinoplanes lobatus]|uniref:Uncharacterized protein n=1 Tax=Actinoplanes lobatus TaxID=113568 RepID=A0A7W7MHU2_9ACTN|nr:hypothetical protein [Actinoplanes lobatus]MBB4750736.1 hypothetical protein [Actinoplanes lobatus]GIE42177.1 hypothetical protein Alo02nite_50750 [Actinoplanes lobatus]